MARVEIASQAWGTLFTKDVNPAITTVQVMPSAVATLKNLDGTNATIWTAVTGGTSNTSALSSDSIGVLGQSSAARFVEEGTYSLTVASTTRRVEATRGEYGAPANARTAGADNTGTVDATTAIQGLLDTVTHTIVPPGGNRPDRPAGADRHHDSRPVAARTIEDDRPRRADLSRHRSERLVLAGGER
jgi:hypothetical protein